MGRYRYVEAPLTPFGKWAQREIYSSADRAMAGKGLMLPGDVARMTRMLQSGLDREYVESQDWTQNQIERTVAPEDTTVRNYITALGRNNYVSARNSIPERFELQKLGDITSGIDMATESVSGERGVATQLANMRTQNSLALNEIPSESSGIAYGIGGGLGWAMGSDWGRNPIDPAIRYGRIMSSMGGM